jgi:UDP-N-acetylglucosamine--N-acetylmuramyl-(pentapeptide) pyrophosphoryl-undecaprenol N-acetylglucosamine transferase
MVLLAALLGFPTAIAEQNAVAGRTNKALGRVVDKVFLTFPESAAAFPRHKVRLTGNPVRPELLEKAASAEPPRWTSGPEAEFHVLVFGGSQGAHGINRVMMDALPHLKALPLALSLLHQSAPGQIPLLREAYMAAGITHELVDFIHDMERAYLWAHLVVCRAGSASLAEIALFKRPSILIPFPHAVDDHQALNARAFETAGAAVILPQERLTGERLAATLDELRKDPRRLAEMGAKAGTLARPDAAQRMVEECMGLLKRGTAHG